MPDNSARMVKVIFTQMCPHCSKTLMVASRFQTPVIDWVLKPEDLEAAKKQLADEIRKSPKFKSEDERKQVLAWVENPETLLGPEEIVPMLQQLIPKEDDPNEKTVQEN